MASQEQNTTPTGRSEGSWSSRGPRPLPRARGKASGGLQPRLHAEGRAVTSSLRPQNPERAETGTLSQRSPAAPGARPRRQKESEKRGGGGGETVHRGTYLPPSHPQPRLPLPPLCHRLSSGAQAPPNRKRLRAPPPSSTTAASRPIISQPAAYAQLPQAATGPRLA